MRSGGQIFNKTIPTLVRPEPGPMQAGAMRAHAMLPTESPYDPSETATPGPQVTDWLYLQLLNADLTQVVEQRSVFLTQTGWLTDLDGSPGIDLSHVADGSYNLKLVHRNHFFALSSSTITLAGSAASYDFTTAGTQTRNASTAVEVAEGVWGVACGDIDRDDYITSSDYVQMYNEYRLGVSDYYDGDLDFDGVVGLTDYDLWKANAAQGMQQ